MRSKEVGRLRKRAAAGTLVGGLSVALGGTGGALLTKWPAVAFAAAAASLVLAIWALGLILDKEE